MINHIGKAPSNMYYILTSSVLVRVQKEDMYSYPDLECWTYTHC